MLGSLLLAMGRVARVVEMAAKSASNKTQKLDSKVNFNDSPTHFKFLPHKEP